MIELEQGVWQDCYAESEVLLPSGGFATLCILSRSCHRGFTTFSSVVSHVYIEREIYESMYKNSIEIIGIGPFHHVRKPI